MQSGEDTSGRVRQATIMDWANDSKDYNLSMSIPENISGDHETKLVEETYNKIRGILGLSEIKI